MVCLSDFHIHSFYSGENGHAQGSLRDIVEAARARGLREILITDHGPGHLSYGLDVKKIPQIRAEVDSLNEEFKDISILLGCESNIVGSKGQIDLDDKYLRYFDRINVGYHFGIIPRDLKFFYSFVIINSLAKLIKSLRPYAARLNTDAMIRVIEKNNIFTITHPGSKAPVEILRLAKACEKRGTALELNSSGHGKLALQDIIEAMKTDVKFTLGSDAHCPDRVGDLNNSMARLDVAELDKERIINSFQ